MGKAKQHIEITAHRLRAQAAGSTNQVARDSIVGEHFPPEERARLLAKHLEDVATGFRVCDRLLADARDAVRVAKMLAEGKLKWPDDSTRSGLRDAITHAASSHVQTEVLRNVAQSMATLSELASVTIANARAQAGSLGSAQPARTGGAD